MSRPKVNQSHLLQPFDAILGSVAAVRILRVLSLHQDAVSASTLAFRTGVGRAGVHKALRRLEETHIIERVGVERSAAYRLTRGHSLSRNVAALFQNEAARSDGLFEAIHSAAKNMSVPPEAVWLFGSAARGSDSPSSDLDIAVVTADVGNATESSDPLETELLSFVAQNGYQLSLIRLTRQDVSRLALEQGEFWKNLLRDAVPIVGGHPSAYAQ